jgi:hypothetical protein
MSKNNKMYHTSNSQERIVEIKHKYEIRNIYENTKYEMFTKIRNTKCLRKYEIRNITKI